MDVRVITSAVEFEAIKPLWRRLFDAGHYSLFQSFEWNHAAARIFSSRERPYVVMAQDSGGAAIIPAAIRETDRTLVLLGEELFDYRDLLSDGSSDALHRAWRELAVLGLPFSLTAIPGDPTGIWTEFNRSYFSAAFAVNASEPVSNHHLAKQWRRLLREGFELGLSDGRDQATIRQLYENKAAQDKDCLFRDPLRIEMLCKMAELAADRTELFTLRKAGELASACLTFRDRNCRRIYGIYYDERWQHLSPGVSLMYHVAQDALSRGMDVDLLTGEQWYKSRIGNKRMPLYRLTASAEELQEMFRSVTSLVA